MIYKANLTTQNNRRIALVASRFNTLIVEQLVNGSIETLEMHGVSKDRIDVFWVPGAYEIPIVLKKISATKKYDGIVTLGAVIKGSTDHYDLVINAVSNGVSQVSLQTNTPIVFGVLTTDTLEQAQQRSGAKAGNKGSEVSLALLELISIFEKIDNL